MIRPLLALLILCAACAFAHAQSFARRDGSDNQVIEDATADQLVAARAIFLLKRLDDDVIVYRSLGEFEENGKLARVSFERFQADLRNVSLEMQAIISHLPARRFKTELLNALASYRDGAFYWRQVYQPRVVNVSSLTENPNSTPADHFFQANTLYTVAVYWRQANRYLKRAIHVATNFS